MLSAELLQLFAEMVSAMQENHVLLTAAEEAEAAPAEAAVEVLKQLLVQKTGSALLGLLIYVQQATCKQGHAVIQTTAEQLRISQKNHNSASMFLLKRLLQR